MLLSKDIDNKVFNYIDQWCETLAYIAWDIRASYHRTLQAIPGQAIFGRDMIFNITSVVDWRFITTSNQQQVEIDIV